MLFIIDFDGTLSVKDTIDDMLEHFADPSWEDIEQSWLNGEINAVECMTQQVRMVKTDNITLESFFRGIQLDATFMPFYKHISQFAKVAIVSDGLDHAVKVAMRNAAMPDIPVYANHLHFTPSGLDISFPNKVEGCAGGNGTCKCAIAQNLALDANGPVVLIGDGKSDACLAGRADIVFAKGSLIKHCEKNAIQHHKFQTFADVLSKVKTWPQNVPQDMPQQAPRKVASLRA